MSDLVVFVVIVAAVSGVGIALGMIVAGRLDRLLAPRSGATPASGPDPATPPPEVQEELP